MLADMVVCVTSNELAWSIRPLCGEAYCIELMIACETARKTRITEFTDNLHGLSLLGASVNEIPKKY